MLRALLVLFLLPGSGVEASGSGTLLGQHRVLAVAGKARNFFFRPDGKPSGLQKMLATGSTAAVIGAASLVWVQPTASYAPVEISARWRDGSLTRLSHSQRRAYYDQPQEEGYYPAPTDQLGNYTDLSAYEPGDRVTTRLGYVVIEKKNQHGSTYYTDIFGKVIGIDDQTITQAEVGAEDLGDAITQLYKEIGKLMLTDYKIYDPDYHAALANVKHLHKELSSIFAQEVHPDNGGNTNFGKGLASIDLTQISSHLDAIADMSLEGFVRNGMGWIGYRIKVGRGGVEFPDGMLILGIHNDDRPLYHARKAELTAMDYEGVYVHYLDRYGRSAMGRAFPLYTFPELIKVTNHRGEDSIIPLAQVSGVFITMKSPLYGKDIAFADSDMQLYGQEQDIPEARDVVSWHGTVLREFSNGYQFVRVHSLQNRGKDDFQELANPFLAYVNYGEQLPTSPPLVGASPRP